MSLTRNQIATLMQLVAETTPDEMDCSGCLDHLAEFAETHLAGRQLSDALAEVQTHMENCPCCEHEFQSFMEALKGMTDDSP
jgi:bacterioferritin-associated ferredoxin